jgi:hypothetical protein
MEHLWMRSCGFPGLKGRTHISLLFLFLYHLVMKRYGVRLFLRRLTAGFFLPFLLSQSGQIRVNEIKKLIICRATLHFKHFLRILRSLVTLNQESNRNLLKTRLMVETRKRTFFKFSFVVWHSPTEIWLFSLYLQGFAWSLENGVFLRRFAIWALSFN